MVNLNKKNQRGFVLAEFAIALPLLILLTYSLCVIDLRTWGIFNAQVADYVLETQAQNILNMIADDARAASEIHIKKDRIVFSCCTHSGSGTFKTEDTQRIYAVHTPNNDSNSHVYFKHGDDDKYNNPLTGKTRYGENYIKSLKFEAINPQVLHITIEMGNTRNNQLVKFSTAVFAPACQQIDYGSQDSNE